MIPETGVVVCSICKQVAEHPELRGKIFRRKDGKATPMSFSATLVEIAGGVEKLLEEWEEETWT